ncbi:hypothetical protein EDC04DRAFT_2782441, partial [Pisolithus marmoratus]
MAANTHDLSCFSVTRSPIGAGVWAGSLSDWLAKLGLHFNIPPDVISNKLGLANHACRLDVINRELGGYQHVLRNLYKENLKHLVNMVTSPTSPQYLLYTRIILITLPPSTLTRDRIVTLMQLKHVWTTM